MTDVHLWTFRPQEDEFLTKPADSPPAAALQLIAAVLAHHRIAPAAASVASELATRLDCDRVSIGFVEDDFSRIAALSHGVVPESDAELLNDLASAMDEAIEQQASIRFPSLNLNPAPITLAHQTIQRRQGGGVCTIPMVAERKIVGAILFEFHNTGQFDAAGIIEYEHLIGLLAPILELKRRNERPWRKRLADSLRAMWELLHTTEKAPWRLALFGTLLLLPILLLLPLNYKVGGQARIEGAVQRVLVAPANGFLKQALVRPGDHVKLGQVLVEMAEQDLLIERRKWSSELAQHENAYSAALAKSDRAQLVINQAKADEARAQLELVEQQVERARIEAPFDGIVIKGDLSQSLGAPVQRGDTLITLAPLDQFRVIVEIDERDIGRIHIGQNGKLALSALPWDNLPIHVSRITPMATAVEGSNVFEVEASIEAPPDRLKPGLQGVARIEAGKQPLLWNWTHRGVEWLALKFWGWTGI